MSPFPLGILAAAGAAAGGGSYDLLETTVLGSSQSSVSFTGLGAYTDYKHLQIRAVARSARSAGSADTVELRLNGDSGANYAQHRIFGSGSSVASDSNTSVTEIRQFLVAQSTDATGAFGAGVIDLLDPFDTGKNTTTRALGGSTAGADQISLMSGLHLSTSALDSIELVTGNALNFVTGSRFSLYGLKAGA